MSTPAPWLRATICDEQGKPIDPVALYRKERAKSRARNAEGEKALRARLKAVLKEQDARDLAAGRGGRPRKVTGKLQADTPGPRPAAKGKPKGALRCPTCGRAKPPKAALCASCEREVPCTRCGEPKNRVGGGLCGRCKRGKGPRKRAAKRAAA